MNAAQLRKRLIDGLVKRGDINSELIEEAFRQVERHKFVENAVSLREAYKNRAVSLKEEISSLSQPSVMAQMLESLELEPEIKVLEVGTASGYNAALLSEIVGAENVYTVELESDLVEKASQNLPSEVTVVNRDGYLGYPEAAPYKRIIVTAQALKIPTPLLNQLVITGKLIIPYNFYDIVTLLAKVTKEKSRVSVEIINHPVNFVPFRKDGQQEKKEKELIQIAYKDIYNRAINEGEHLSLSEKINILLTIMKFYYTKPNIKVRNNYHTIYEAWKNNYRDKDKFDLTVVEEKIVTE